MVSISHQVDRILQSKDQPAVPIQESNQKLLKCPYWPTAYAGVIQLSEHHAAPATALHDCQLLNYWKITWQNDMGIKERIPEPSPSQMKRNIPLLSVFSAKEIKLTDITSFAYQFLTALLLDEKRKLLKTATSELKKLEVFTKCMHYYATLYCFFCFPTSSFIPSGNSVFKISQGFGKAAEVKAGNGTHASGNPA